MDGGRTAALVRAARAGDEASFAALVRAWQDMAVAYATALLGDRHRAEDAAQEAFVDAYRALPALREPAAFGAWLRTIVFKHCDRQRRRVHPELTGLDAALAVAAPGPTPAEALEAAETRRALGAAIATLTDAEQQVVLLYYMGGHSQAAIAAFLGITANAVKTRLHSARGRLRRYMDEIEENLDAARPSRDGAFAARVARLIRPDALARREPLVWSPGLGADVWDMFLAAMAGDVAELGRLVARDPSLLRCSHEYRTPLGFAVRENRLEAVAWLLDRGAPVHEELPAVAHERGFVEMERLLAAKLAAQAGVSPRGAVIAEAIRARDVERVRRLLDHEPDLVHAADERANRPIHWAVMTRQPDMIDLLLERGADIAAQRADGARPIQLANGDYHYRGWLHDHPVKPRDIIAHLRARGATCDICTASYIGDMEQVRALLAEDPSLANRPSDYVTYYACSGTPLRNAASGGHIDIVRLLLEHGADPNLPEEGIAPRGHALHSAVYAGHYAIVELLLEHGAHANVEIESSADTLSAALARDDRRMVDLLCSHGAARRLHLLAYYDDVRTAAAMLAADPSLADDPEALANADSHAFVRLLLRYAPGLPRRVTTAKSRSLTELLFRHGMDPSRPDWLRITPLHRFAGRGDVENAALFLDHGADIDAVDEEERTTPLGRAARAGRARMVAFLLRRGADPSQPAEPAWARPRARAERLGHAHVVALLDDYERTGAPPPAADAARLASLADDFVAAEAGDADAARRIAAYFELEVKTLRVGETIPGSVRRHIRDGLRRLYAPDQAPATLTQQDARALVARLEGFPDWEAATRGGRSRSGGGEP